MGATKNQGADVSGTGQEELAPRLAARLSNIRAIVGGCHRRMGSPLNADDFDEVVQETSLTAWRTRMEFRGDSDLDTWLYGIARFTILGRLRRLRTAHWAELELSAEDELPAFAGPSPGTQADTGFARILEEGLAEGGATLAAIYRKRALEGESFGRISEELAVSEARVKARFYRSLPQMRQRFQGLWRDLSGC